MGIAEPGSHAAGPAAGDPDGAAVVDRGRAGGDAGCGDGAGHDLVERRVERRTEAAPSEKAVLRSTILRRRRARLRQAPAGVAADGAAVAAVVLGSPEITRLRPGATVAAYLELPTELSAADVRAGLHARGIGVLVPVLRADRDLDWVRWLPAGPGSPAGVPADHAGGQPADIADAAAILLPGVAGDRAGNRLGRGGGSYDRVLGRVLGRAVAGPGAAAGPGDPGAGRPGGPPPQRPWTCVLVFTDELLTAVPVEPHDVRVDAVATPAGLHRVEPHDRSDLR